MTSRSLRRFGALLRRDPVGLALLGALVLIGLAVAVGPLLTSHDPVEVNYAAALAPPSWEHPLGADDFGRDVLTRLLHGGRVSLALAALAVSLIITVSLAVGVTAGYFGGWADLALTRLIDVLLSFPRLALAIAIASLMGLGVASLLVAVTAVAWPSYARIFRGLTLQVKNEGYVQAARLAGTPVWKLLLSHIVLTIIGPVLVLTMLDAGQIILTIASLSFLGLGIAPPAPEWGAMLNEGRPYLEEAPWLFLAPGLTIFTVVISVNYLGDAVRDAVESRPTFGPRHWIVWGRRSAADGAPATAAPVSGLPPSLRAPLLELDGVEVRVRDPRAADGGAAILRGVSLSLAPGECVGLVGESGSGKSTIAAATLGLLRPPLAVTAGTVRLFGRDTAGWDWDAWRAVRGRRIALVSQDPMSALNPVLRVGDQVGECLRYHQRISRAEVARRTREMLERVGLNQEASRLYPHQMSGGMRQRVAIAMALINRPDVVIADEPTTALDMSTQAQVLALLAELRRDLGIGMIFISHDLRVVAQVADRVIVLREGAVVEQNTVRGVFTAPQHPSTQELVGALPGAALRRPAGAGAERGSDA